MDLEAARNTLLSYLRSLFGQVVSLREVSVERSTSGRVFVGEVVCVSGAGEIPIGEVGISEDGDIVRPLTTDALIERLMAAGRSFDGPDEGCDAEATFSLLSDEDIATGALLGDSDPDDAEDLEGFFSERDSPDVMQRIIALLASGERADLLTARRLMPRLLVDHYQRGVVLLQMAELELRLDDVPLGLNYLEAAAREFADAGDLVGLERAEALARKVLPAGAREAHVTANLLQQTRDRVTPLTSPAHAPPFAELAPSEQAAVFAHLSEVSAEPGTVLLREGDPATQAFVVQSGILGIDLETPGGASRTVRCCFPGELVGESCIHGPGATCNATVFAKQACTLWHIPGEALRALVAQIPALRARLEASRTIHRLDSFFSMNEATNTLDAQVRDRLLSCVTAIRHVDANELVEARDTQPRGVYLVARGRLVKHPVGAPARRYGADTFVCLKETLHRLPLEGDVVAEERTQLVVFDPDALFELAMGAPPAVAAVLDRLE